MAFTDYKVIKAPISAIEALVLAAIADNWVPFGSPAVMYPQDKEIYQALVKGTPDEGAITDYKVVRAPIDAIQGQVLADIADDWQPFGTLAVLYPQDKEVFQALVKITV